MAEGKLFINGVQQYDGDPIGVNGDLPIEKVICNGIVVWQNQRPPNAPTSFNASDGAVGSTTLTWVNSSDVGVPTCTYDVYEDNIKIGTNVTSGYVRNVSGGSRTYKVRAINVAGHADSNTDTGIVHASPGSSEPCGNWVVPSGVYSVTICMIGGGGSGAAPEDIGVSTAGGGGYSGEIVNTTIAVTPGATISTTCGAGGASKTGIGYGNAGGASKFGSVTANGGAGGQTVTGSSASYAGNGGSRSTCMGTFNDGSRQVGAGSYFYGGQAGFANGGSAYGQSGSKGSGGGAAYQHSGSGAGGTGFIEISW